MILKILKVLFRTVIYLAILTVLVVGFCVITEFSPADKEVLKVNGKTNNSINIEDEITILTYDIEHLCYNTNEKQIIKNNSKKELESILNDVKKVIDDENADLVLLQKIDYDSKISYYINEYVELAKDFIGQNSYCITEKTFKPYPLSNIIGKVQTGISIFSKYEFESKRINLPENDVFPTKLFKDKNAVQMASLEIDQTDKYLMLYNVDLSIEDEKETISKQYTLIQEEMQKEYENGNYCILSGRFVDGENEESSLEAIKNTYFGEDWKIVYYELPSENIENVSEENDEITEQEVIVEEKNTIEYTGYIGFIVSPNINVEKMERSEIETMHTSTMPLKVKITFEQVDEN